MISIFIAILALAVGVYIGSLVFGGKEPSEKPTDRNSPLVICMVFHKNLTKETLLEVLKPRAFQIARHFDLPIYPVDEKFWNSFDQLADKIMQWWNPDYPELVLVAHKLEGRVVLNWTWAVQSNGVVDELGR